MLGDWNGQRSALEDQGVALSLNYIGEQAGNLDGGRRGGTDYAQQVELDADIDWKKLAGLNGFSTHAVLINRAGRNLSSDYVGDNLFQAQEIYGGGGNVLIHLVYVYAEQKFSDGRIDLAAGRLAAGNDFASSPLYCDFMNTGICGYPHSLPNKVGFTAFPNSTWGGRVRFDPGNHVYIQAGLYQVRPQLGGRAGLDFGTSDTTGGYIPVELGYEPTLGEDEMPGHYKIGVTHDTSNYPDLNRNAFGQPLVSSGGPALNHRGCGSEYLLVDQMLVRNGSGPMNGVIAFAGMVHSSPQTSQFEWFTFGGIVDQGVFDARPDDSIGASIAYAKIGNPLIQTEALQSQHGLPLAMDAVGVQSNEILMEARYSFKITDGLHIMPDLQYVVRPGAATRYQNATILALHIAADL